MNIHESAKQRLQGSYRDRRRAKTRLTTSILVAFRTCYFTRTRSAEILPEEPAQLFKLKIYLYIFLIIHQSFCTLKDLILAA